MFLGTLEGFGQVISRERKSACVIEGGQGWNLVSIQNDGTAEELGGYIRDVGVFDLFRFNSGGADVDFDGQVPASS